MYRVDQRNFSSCDIIEPPENSYQESEDFGEDKQKLENILNEERPDDKKNADRKAGLYIFAELSDAIRFCCVMSDSKIYKVTSMPDTICYHRRDMNWTEIMNKFLDNEQMLKQLAKFYWEGNKTFKPCWEILVNKVQVAEVIVNNASRNNLCQEYYASSGNVEKVGAFLTNLNQ